MAGGYKDFIEVVCKQVKTALRLRKKGMPWLADKLVMTRERLEALLEGKIDMTMREYFHINAYISPELPKEAKTKKECCGKKCKPKVSKVTPKKVVRREKRK